MEIGSAKINRIFIVILLFLIVFFLILRINKIYYVVSNSMHPTLQVGDLLIVKPISTERLSKGEICIKKTIDEKGNLKKSVKRIAATPGDTLCIVNGVVFVNGVIQNFFYTVNGILTQGSAGGESVFPNDTVNFKWTANDFGPIVIPRKGDTMVLTKDNSIIYKNIIMAEISGTAVNLPTTQLCGNGPFVFNKNYYFCLGDNLAFSYDSRYWGLVSEDDFIGKATRVLFSCKKPKRFFIPL